MIISGADLNINAALGAEIKNKAENNSFANNVGVKRNDKLDLSELFRKYTDSDDFQKTEIKAMLLEIDKRDELNKEEKARQCFMEMQRILKAELSNAVYEKDLYNTYSKEKQYYQGLLDSCDGDSITITDGKYLLSDLIDGTAVSKDELAALIDSVDQRIKNELIDRKEAPIGDTPLLGEEFWADQEYRKTHVVVPDYSDYESTVWADAARQSYNDFLEGFADATGMGSDLFADKDDPLFSRTGYTANNFLAKTNERIMLLNERLAALQKAMKNYLEKEKAAQAYLSNMDMTGKLTIYFRQQKSASEMLDDFDKMINQDDEKL